MTAARIDLYARALTECGLKPSDETCTSFAQHLAAMLFLGHVEEGVLDDLIVLRECLGGWLVRREQLLPKAVFFLLQCPHLRWGHPYWHELLRVAWSLLDQVEYDRDLFPCGPLTDETIEFASLQHARDLNRRDPRVHAVTRTSLLPGVAKEGEVSMDNFPERGAYKTERAPNLIYAEKFLRAARAQHPNVALWVEHNVNGITLDDLARKERVSLWTMRKRIGRASKFLVALARKEGLL
jgi:hypothetical protein